MLNERHRRSAGLGSGRVTVALSAAALVVALLGVIPVSSAGSSAVELARGSISGSPAASQKPIRGPRGPRGRTGARGPQGIPELRESEARRAFKDRKGTVVRPVNAVRRASGAPPAQRSRLAFGLHARRSPRIRSSQRSGRSRATSGLSVRTKRTCC